MKHPKYARSFEVSLQIPQTLAGLDTLAYNFRWAWHPDTRRLFRSIDPLLWEQVGHNPVGLLFETPSDRLAELGGDRGFTQHLARCVQALDSYLSAETWFDRSYGTRAEPLIAYFCAEFGLSEALPIYSGGLGVLAGDHLKAASDLGLPLVAVGLLYARGYFRQELGPDYWQREFYPLYDYHRYPIRMVRDEQGRPIRVTIPLPDRAIQCLIWHAQVGRVSLYLLDSNTLDNAPGDRLITDTLYGGDEDMRLRQELLLGVGGVRALEALGIEPTVWHMNEGHAAFLANERVRQIGERQAIDHRTARQIAVAGNVFTTHTPVPAGFDRFTHASLKHYLALAVEAAGVPFDTFEAMGRFEPANPDEPFGMAVYAIRNSNSINGVSELHAGVSRGMFSGVWPDYAEAECPIGAITNGVHTASWISAEMGELFDHRLGRAWRDQPDAPEAWADVAMIPAEELWQVRCDLRRQLVEFVRSSLAERDQRAGVVTPSSRYDSVLDPDALTIGFARRFATYKRASLLIRDRERLKALLLDAERPLQLVMAGKSHPRDDGGKRIIQDLCQFIEREGLAHRFVFLEDYDMRTARTLVQGVDVWLNTPRRPMEASGTSGMKGIPNGVLNCSILDGWWDEGYDPSVGWAIGTRRSVDDEYLQDWKDSLSLYRLLEEEIVPRFYGREDGLPLSWLGMVKQSIQTLSHRFSTHRMVGDYTERFYMPAASHVARLMADDLAGAKQAIEWRDRVRAAWDAVTVVQVDDELPQPAQVGDKGVLTATVDLGGLGPEDVLVEALVGRAASDRELHAWRSVVLGWVGGKAKQHRFSGEFTFDEPGPLAYVVRVRPFNPSVKVETELPLVRWQ